MPPTFIVIISRAVLSPNVSEIVGQTTPIQVSEAASRNGFQVVPHEARLLVETGLLFSGRISDDGGVVVCFRLELGLPLVSAQVFKGVDLKGAPVEARTDRKSEGVQDRIGLRCHRWPWA